MTFEQHKLDLSQAAGQLEKAIHAAQSDGFSVGLDCVDPDHTTQARLIFIRLGANVPGGAV